MKVSRRLVLAAAPLVVAVALAARAQEGDGSLEPKVKPAAPAPEGATRLTLLYTSDIHGHYLPHLSVGKRGKKGDEPPKPVKVGGLAAIAAKVKELRDAKQEVLVFDSGDVMSGHPVCDLEREGAKGGALFKLMNLVGYDAMCIGNHDFDHGRDNTAKLCQVAKFPVLSANLKFEGDPAMPIKRWTILEKAGLKIGVFGLMTDNLMKVVGKEKVPGVTVTPSKEAAVEAVAELRAKCDLVIGLSHCGSGEDARLAKEVPGIDVMLSGHDHRPVEPRQGESGTILTEGACKALRLGRLDLFVKDKKLVGHEGHLMILPAVEPEGEIKAVVDDVYEACQKRLEEVLGKLETAWKRENAAESNIGDFFCDALCQKTTAQVSFLNSGGIRRDVPAGPFTLGDVVEIFPIENELVVFELTGEQLLQALARNAAAAVGRLHGVLQVGGVRYEYEKTGKREAKVLKASVGGEDVDPKKTYKCVATDFVALDQAEKYFGVVPSKPEKLGYGMQEVAIEAVRAAVAKGALKTVTDGRMKLVKE